MAKSRSRLLFPMGGLFRRFGFQAQPPFTCCDARNVRPRLSMPGREQGGTRPGLLKHSLVRMETGGSADAINMLGQVQYNESTLSNYLDDDVEGFDNDEDWSVPAWLQTPNIDGEDKAWYADHNAGNPFGLVRSAQSQDTTQDVALMLVAVPYRGAHAATYRFYLHMNNATPVATTGGGVVEVSLTLSTAAGVDSLTYQAKQNGSNLTAASGTVSLGFHDVRIFKLEWFYNGALSTSPTMILTYGPTAANGEMSTVLFDNGTNGLIAPTYATYTRFGWSMAPTASGNRAIVDSFRAWWQMATGNRRSVVQSRMVAGAGGKIYAEGRAGTVVEIDSAWSVQATEPVMTSQHRQQLYIADNGGILYDGAMNTTYVALTTYQPRLSAVSVSDWVALGANVRDFVVEVYSSTNADIPIGVYTIATVNTASLDLERSSGSDPTGTGDITARVRRGPKIYDPTASSNQLTQLKTASTIAIQNTYDADNGGKGCPPAGCPLIATYRDRLVLAGNPAYAWFMSRSGDPTDWLYVLDASDVGAPIAGTTAPAGNIPGDLTALIAYSNDFMIFATADSMFLLRGDPAEGGGFLATSRQIGVLSAAAWTLDENNILYGLSRRGLFRSNPDGSNVELLSEQKIPAELAGLDPSLVWANLCYDPLDIGIHIYVTGRFKRKRYWHWWYDLRNDSYWPMTLNDTHDPLFAIRSLGYLTKRTHVVLAGRDGTLRYYNRHARTDDGQTIVSKVVYGPFAGGSVGAQSRLDEIECSLPQHSESAVLHVHSGMTPEQAAQAAIAGSDSKFSKTISRGLNRGIYPMVSGGAFCLRVVDSGSNRWALETVEAVAKDAGKLRP